jgi:alanine dehydrogenase
MNKIGIRHEDKYLLERRVALTPEHVAHLIQHEGLEVFVQRSAKRVFTAEEYEAAGAIMVDEFPEDVHVYFGVKEMPNAFFRTHSTNVFFSHTIKGQEYNMGMLRTMMDQKVNLIDYEMIASDKGRLIFFGRFAGLAGAINSLWSLGQRYKLKGIENPFGDMQQAYRYASLEEARSQIIHIAQDIKTNGLPREMGPLVIGITGYGNVSRGAQELIDLLPIKEISATELLQLDLDVCSSNEVIKVVFKEEDLSRHKEGHDFVLQHYYEHPEEYENQFESYVSKIQVLMNCMYWDPKYPRILSKDFLEEHFTSASARLEVIGDVTCDPDGSIEPTYAGTAIIDPVYVYNPLNRQYNHSFQGEGILIMAVDILPSELPRESSQAFGDALLPFATSIVKADYFQSYDQLDLPDEVKKALILHNGELTPPYTYLNKHLISTNQ